MISILVVIFTLGGEPHEFVMSTAECLQLKEDVLHGEKVTIAMDGGRPSPPIIAAECRPPCDCEEEGTS